MEPLTTEEVEKCQQAFEKFDKNGNGSIDIFELKAVLQAVGHNATEEELFEMIKEVDGNGNGEIEFQEFLKVIEKQNAQSRKYAIDNDTVDAFVAMGGNPDKSGQIRAEKLVKTIKEFQLTIDIEQLIAETDTDHSGFIDFDEFSAMLND